MADYWKSLPRKFCDICKCWFADNKASIDFHEKGKRHQENVKKRINELQKKGLKEYEAQKNLENDMKKIEQAALQAYKKDLEQNPELAKKFVEDHVNKQSKIYEKEESLGKDEKDSLGKEEKNEKKESSSKEESPEEEEDSSESAVAQGKTSEKEWYEATSEEGHIYYWNINTSASQWEPPEEGYVSIEEQQQLQQAVDEPVAEQDEKNSQTLKDEKSEKDSDDETPVNAIGPQPKPDPYGQWVTVEHQVEDPVDLQLPEKSDNVVEMHIPLTKDDTRIKIKEKIIGHLDDSFSSENSFFKKRKNITGVKRNVRQRLKDDD